MSKKHLPHKFHQVINTLQMSWLKSKEVSNFEHCLWLRCPSKNSDSSMPFYAGQILESLMANDLGYKVDTPTLPSPLPGKKIIGIHCGNVYATPAHESIAMHILHTLPSFTDGLAEIKQLLPLNNKPHRIDCSSLNGMI